MTTTAHKLDDLRQRLERAQDPGSERSRKRRDDAGRSTHERLFFSISYYGAIEIKNIKK